METTTKNRYLDHNRIDALDRAALARLTELTRLDLSGNRLDVIEPYAFANLTKLSTLLVIC